MTPTIPTFDDPTGFSRHCAEALLAADDALAVVKDWSRNQKHAPPPGVHGPSFRRRLEDYDHADNRLGRLKAAVTLLQQDRSRYSQGSWMFHPEATNTDSKVTRYDQVAEAWVERMEGHRRRIEEEIKGAFGLLGLPFSETWYVHTRNRG